MVQAMLRKLRVAAFCPKFIMPLCEVRYYRTWAWSLAVAGKKVNKRVGGRTKRSKV